jgi:trans-aconitate methyltransferase
MTEQCSLRKAGADGLRFNSPLSEARANYLIDLVTDDGPTSLIDLGCGKGELLLSAVQSHSGLHGTGIDSDAAVIAQARQEARRLSVQGRAAFITGDAIQWAAPQSQAGICVGASHIFGGVEPTLTRLGELVSHGRVLVADGFWAADPDAWFLATLWRHVEVVARAVQHVDPATVSRIGGRSCRRCACRTRSHPRDRAVPDSQMRN